LFPGLFLPVQYPGLLFLNTIQTSLTQQNSRADLFQRLQGKSFWIWDKHQHKQEDIRTDGDCCFNHIIGLPQKDENDNPLYDYEQLIFESLVTPNGNKHLWIKKATGLGVSEFMLRFMAWLCLKDNSYRNSQICIAKSINAEDIAIKILVKLDTTISPLLAGCSSTIPSRTFRRPRIFCSFFVVLGILLSPSIPWRPN
jgi:hypothetical protein